MTAIVIDTNVLLVADGQAKQMSDACVSACLTRLERVRAKEQVVLDDSSLILDEYHNKLFPYKSQEPGSAFLKWLLQVQGDSRHVSWVTITLTNAEYKTFAEFPSDAELEAAFDADDRKFVAAANAHPDKPSILQAADSKWLGWEDQLKQHGIQVEYPCRGELKEIQKRNSKRK